MRIHILFVLFPYIATVFLIGGFAVRYILLHKKPSIGMSESVFVQRLLENKLLRNGLLLLAIGHLSGIIFPRAILLWNALMWHLYLLEMIGYLIGVTVIFSILRPIWKDLTDDNKSVKSVITDTAFLSLLLVGLLSGLLTAVIHRWGSLWATATLTPYILSLVHGKPGAVLISGLPFLVRLHVFSAFAAIAVFPFTRPALSLMLVFHRLIAFTTKPALAWAKSTSDALQGWAKRYDPAPWIWPEEED